MNVPVCKDCEYAIYCPTWGEYKCTKHSRKFISYLVGCKDHKTRGKDFEEKPCQCETCMERSRDNDV